MCLHVCVCILQVQRLLDSIGMKQYCDVFERERIDGEALADMDYEMMTDLGISSKFHRMRLLKVRVGREKKHIV